MDSQLHSSNRFSFYSILGGTLLPFIAFFLLDGEFELVEIKPIYEIWLMSLLILIGLAMVILGISIWIMNLRPAELVGIRGERLIYRNLPDL